MTTRTVRVLAVLVALAATVVPAHAGSDPVPLATYATATSNTGVYLWTWNDAIGAAHVCVDVEQPSRSINGCGDPTVYSADLIASQVHVEASLQLHDGSTTRLATVDALFAGQGTFAPLFCYYAFFLPSPCVLAPAVGVTKHADITGTITVAGIGTFSGGPTWSADIIWGDVLYDVRRLIL